MDGSEMQQVTVAVPAARLPEFYEMYGRWLRGSVAGTATEPEEERAPMAFDQAPTATVASWWKRLSAPAKRLFGHLAEHADQRFDGAELAAACAIEKGPAAVAGTFSWPGNYAARLNLEFPLSWDREEQKYWVSRPVAEAIRTAAREQGPV